MAESKAGMSLTDFAASRKPKTVCRVCELPELAEIHAAREHGVSYDNIVDWLVEVKGYEPGFISDHRLALHLRSHV